MRNKLKKTMAFILSAAMIFVLLPAQSAFAIEPPSITLGSATLTDGKYYYKDAEVTGDGIRTILINFSGNVAAGDSITLPTAAGFTVSGNSYSKRINIDTATTGTDNASAVRAYLCDVGFSVASATQTVSVTVTSDNITNDTFYNKDTQHYYQFITYASGTTGTWTDAYDSAKLLTYMGRTGYLATVTSLDEDEFLYELSGNKTGWLGGTTLAPGDRTDETGAADNNGLYYKFPDTAANVNRWYWACGPEIGKLFYSVALKSDTSDSDSVSAGYYFNWGRGDEPNGDGDESCLTTLVVSPSNDGYSDTTYGYQNKAFSWNNIVFNRAYSSDGRYFAKGYFVEYGNQGESDGWGDSGSDSAAFATASGALTDPSEIALTTVSRPNVSTYTCDVDLPVSSKMVTISVDSGYFTVPSDGGGVLHFLGGTNGTNYISDYTDSTQQFDSAVFSFTTPSAAADLLDDIIYTHGSGTTQKITATSSAVSPIGSDLYFGGHFYRYVSGSINWPTAVKNAGNTTDPYFGGRGYIATATSQAENSILLRLTSTTDTVAASDGYYDAYLGGLWQRNTGTAESPTITQGADGNEITYEDIASAATMTSLLPDYSETYGNVGNIYEHPETVKYYWVDGPEAGQEIENNASGAFSPWHQGEPNSGDFVYIGYEGAYWDDQSADVTGGIYAVNNGYIVEFSGFGAGGSTNGIIKNAEKAVNASYSITYNLDSGTNPVDAPTTYTYGTGATLPAPTKSGLNFGGWYTNAGFTGSAVSSIVPTDTGAKEYWAKWTAITDDYMPSRTITVTETSSPLFAGGGGSVLAKANVDNAFSTSVEVKVTDTKQEKSSFGLGAGTDVYPFDISLYIKGTSTKTEPASGYAVTISLPIPKNLLDVRDKLFIVHKADDGTVATIASSLKQIGGVWYLVFDATKFSPYALAVSNLASYDTASGLPYYLNVSGAKVFIGFAADGKYLAPAGKTVMLTPNPKSFTDISSHWGKTYIDFVTERELFVGTGTNTFSPDTGMTRAMFAAVIGRLYERSYGEISTSDTCAFTDCNYNDYYGKYVKWAEENGIILGVGDGRFQPDRQVTRQEMAAVLYRFAKFMKLDTTAIAGKTPAYPDASSIDSWAKDAALYCQEAGIITGRTGGNFVPDGTATRAEVSAILERFVETAL